MFSDFANFASLVQSQGGCLRIPRRAPQRDGPGRERRLRDVRRPYAGVEAREQLPGQGLVLAGPHGAGRAEEERRELRVRGPERGALRLLGSAQQSSYLANVDKCWSTLFDTIF